MQQPAEREEDLAREAKEELTVSWEAVRQQMEAQAKEAALRAGAAAAAATGPSAAVQWRGREFPVRNEQARVRLAEAPAAAASVAEALSSASSSLDELVAAHDRLDRVYMLAREAVEAGIRQLAASPAAPETQEVFDELRFLRVALVGLQADLGIQLGLARLDRGKDQLGRAVRRGQGQAAGRWGRDKQGGKAPKPEEMVGS